MFDYSVIANNLPYFMVGLWPHGPLGGFALTIYLAVTSCALSILFGIVVGLMGVARHDVIRRVSKIYCEVLRGMPLLMVIFWMYFLLPLATGGAVPESRTVIAALTIFTSAYMGQIVRAGIEGVPRGQMEAAMSTGLGYWQAMIYVVLPQGLRHMIPSFVNQLVSLVKDTSLAFIVGVPELTSIATQVNNRTMIFPFEIFIFIAILYFSLCYTLTAFSRWLERRYS
ncbi:MAG: amino acid ABC transporter permease [Nitrospinae bacterium]|nr:amino acid ABC transporter permease [Nitrospinota bacterium]